MSRWRRTYWAVFISNLVTAVGMMSFLPFFPAILRSLGVADTEEQMLWTGFLFGAAPLAAAVMGPVWGSIGDRHGRKVMVIRAMAGITVFVGLMGFATTPWQLLALRLAQGVFSGFVPPSITLVSISVPREVQGRVTGSLQAALAAGMIVGPLVGERVLASFGAPSLFFFVAGAAALSALLVALFAHEDASLRATAERFAPTSVLGDVRRDLRELLAIERVRWSLLLLFAVQLGVGATTPQLELFVAELTPDADRHLALTAHLYSALAAAGLLASPLWGRAGDRFGHGRALVAACLLLALVLSSHAAVTSYALLFACRILVGIASPGAYVASAGIAATETPQERRGSAFGAVFGARTLAVSIGSFAGGLLAQWLGLRGLFAATGLGIGLLLAVRARPDTESHTTR